MWMRRSRAGTSEVPVEHIGEIGQMGAEQDAGRRPPPALILPALEALSAGRYHDAHEVPGVTGQAIGRLAAGLEASAYATLKRMGAISWETSVTMIAVASMAQDIESASVHAETISSAAVELNASIGAIADIGGAAAAEAARAHEQTQAGVGQVDRAGTAMNTVSAEVRDMTARLDVLQNAVEQIAEMTQTIEDISNQTNLLALNATIEAARAGEAGRGFAVVANEVKALSQQTARATEQIRERTNALTREMAAMMKAMDTNAASVTEASEIVNDVGQRFHGVGHQIAEVSSRITQMAETLEEQKGATEEISRAINLIAEESGRNRAAATSIVKCVSATGKLIGEQFAELDKLAIHNAALERAKSGHMVTRKRLAEMLAGFRKLNERDVPALDGCPFSASCRAEIDVAALRSPEYRAFEDAHGRYHAAVGKVIALHRAGDSRAARSAFEETAGLLDGLVAAIEGLMAAQAGPQRAIA